MKRKQYDVDHILFHWDAFHENRKAEFMEELYQAYQPADHTFTGLWERFKEDLANLYRNAGVGPASVVNSDG